MKSLGKAALLVLVSLAVLSGTAFGDDNEVIIKRDNYGVPHVYAETIYGLFYGYGYAVAQDRLFQMEIAKRSTKGKVAEVLGEKYIDFDKGIRSNYNPVSIQRQLDHLSCKDQDIFNGYAAGMNAWLGEIMKTPDTRMPKEFNEFGFQPEEWSAFDVAMIFVGSMVNRFGDFNTEPANRNILDSLIKIHGDKKAEAIFDQLNPLNIKDAPTTIPAGEWTPPAASSGLSKGRSNAARLSGSIDERHLNPVNVDGYSPAYGVSGASNCVLVGQERVKGANAVLLNGPQFGWYAPSYVYSIGLHGGGFDLVGNTPFAYPVILFGHSHDIAWGSTWGAGDQVDIYREELNPDNSHEYLYKGEYLPMEERTEIIKVKGGRKVEHKVFRTIHGPVIQTDAEHNIAFAKKRTWDGLELESLLGWLYSARARNFDEWLVQAERSALNVNWYYADKHGNIGYAFTGKYPRRAPDHDGRLPASGTGEMEWRGLLPFEYTPRVFNPEQGYLANWNNKPAACVNNPDEFWYSWGKGDRVDVFIKQFEKRQEWDADQIWGLVEISSFSELNAPYFLPVLEKAANASQDAQVKQAVDILKNWDMISRDDDKDGNYDEPATAVFRTFLPKMIEYTLADDLGDTFKFFAGTGYPAPGKPTGAGTNLQTGTKAIIDSLYNGSDREYDFFNGLEPESVALKALTAALEELSKEQGPDMEKWRLPSPERPFSHKNFLGVPQTDESRATSIRIEENRGTENDLIVFTDEGVISYEVAPPGQNAFIAPDGSAGKHYQDQLKMYEEFGKKRMWLDDEDVEKHKESMIVLKLSGN